jgi:hypothetical protein
LISGLLCADPCQRLSIKLALKNQWFKMKLDNLNRSLDGLDPKKKANDEKDAESPMFKPQKTKAGRKMRR